MSILSGIGLDGCISGAETETETAIVPSGGKLPCCFEVSTSKLLDVVVAMAPSYQNVDARQKKKFRKNLYQKLYSKTRPGFYWEASSILHIGYAGQPNGHGTQHQWRLFCAEDLQVKIEIILKGISLTLSSSQPQTSVHEWGGLYLRSEAELRIAQALDWAQILFFANARGRVGLQDTIVSDGQLTGRIEADFMVFYLEQRQTIRDYARDRVLLRFGVPTVRFIAQDCMRRPDEVVSEFLSILMNAAPDWVQDATAEPFGASTH